MLKVAKHWFTSSTLHEPDNASLLRDDIDVMLVNPWKNKVSVSPLRAAPVSLDINEGIHETQSYTTLRHF